MQVVNAMEKSVGALDARRQLGKILDDVSGNGDHYIVNLHGEPVAALVPIALYQRWKRRREAFFDTLDEMATTADLTSAEADALADEAVRAARQRHS